jgi:hypothetical protein
MPIRGLLAILVIAPLGMFAAHAAAFRLLTAAGRRPSAHGSAFVAIVSWFVVTLAAAGTVVYTANAQTVPKVCAVGYVVATYTALSILYVDAVNIAETSLHMHVLLEVLWNDRPSLAQLIERYSAERMIATRLERLTSLGQVRAVDNRYYLANASTLRLNRIIDLWRTVLGLPTAPDQVHVS